MKFKIALYLCKLIFLPLTIVSTAFADITNYSEIESNKALSSGGTVVLDFHATWCPTCIVQSKALQSLKDSGKLKNISVFKVDYDTADFLIKRYDVKRQSTLILFKDGKEVDRRRGLKSPQAIEEFLQGKDKN